MSALIAPIEFGAALDLIERGGPIVMALLALSLIAMTVGIAKTLQFIRFGVGGAREHVHDALSMWSSGRSDDAMNALSRRRDGISTTALHAMRGRVAGTSERHLREDVERAALDYLAGMKSYIRVLEATAQLAPLIGLFGTVIGMMQAFEQLQAAGADADPAALAGGIWIALTTTAVGLAVAIPASFALYWFDGRLAREQDQMESALTRIFTSGPASGLMGTAPATAPGMEGHARAAE